MPVKKVVSLAVTLLALGGMALMFVIGGHAQNDSGREAQAAGKKRRDSTNRPAPT